MPTIVPYQANHVENAWNGALVERMHLDALADEARYDLGLKIGEGEDKIGLEPQNFRDIGACESRHPRLFFSHTGRAHGPFKKVGSFF
ncbi:MAG: hypothetical protein WBX25_02740 [Rhodomicrobium sp.]